MLLSISAGTGDTLSSRSQLYRELQNQPTNPAAASQRPNFAAGLGVILTQGRQYRVRLPSEEDLNLLRTMLTARGHLIPPSGQPSLSMRLRPIGIGGTEKHVSFLGVAGVHEGFILLKMRDKQDGGNVPDHIYWQPLFYTNPHGEKESVDPQFLKHGLVQRVQKQISLIPPGYEGRSEHLCSHYGLMFPGGAYVLAADNAPLQFDVESDQSGSRAVLNLFIQFSPAEIPLSVLSYKNLSPTLAAFLVKQMILNTAMLHSMGVVHNGISSAAFFLSGSELTGTTPPNRLLYLGNFGAARFYTGKPEPFEEAGHVMYYDPETASVFTKVAALRPNVVYGQARDSWSLGRVMFQLLCGGSQHPFGHLGPPASPLVTAKRISMLARDRPALRLSTCFPPTSAPEMQDLMSIMANFLKFDANERPTPLEIVRRYPQLFTPL
ncbi:rhoptry kinase family protein ROP26 (incomplete catalytic triad) [Toxoplasma gondii RUB]|uniref:Rhoptry kinase family protein ROP26 (Incomplete catalytic triad) n=2 Tax=Toxoplasma gondii TaxID=5811 RepID=A0A086LMK4_TOXGO|nr:rhoptry kinase family protein ROP26 (incomplete catalytic triad) [Toxoplasma gondii RUB]KFG99921.1 rhoptry kinase family protein ROP26 (incomplete catalytic triad) [Toxoplasma gondii VAND]